MMAAIYLTAFIVSLTLVVGVFSLSYVENRTGKRYVPIVRQPLDSFALMLRRIAKRFAYGTEHLPALSLAALYFLLHLLAVAVALSARALERSAHKLADSVSHQRNFERRPTRSSFLRQVRHHKETLKVPEEIRGDEKEEA